MRLIGITFLFLMTLPLAACGVKPDSVEPPPGAENTAYPRTYPAPGQK